jgi:hypothetical protein
MTPFRLKLARRRRPPPPACPAAKNRSWRPTTRASAGTSITQKDGTLKFNKLASNVENMETCAATLEGMRLRFMRLGSRTARSPAPIRQLHLPAEGRRVLRRTYDQRPLPLRWCAPATAAWRSRAR